jgi:hypothetical protein
MPTAIQIFYDALLDLAKKFPEISLLRTNPKTHLKNI